MTLAQDTTDGKAISCPPKSKTPEARKDRTRVAQKTDSPASVEFFFYLLPTMSTATTLRVPPSNAIAPPAPEVDGA
jgi:hypothetical protein